MLEDDDKNSTPQAPFETYNEDVDRQRTSDFGGNLEVNQELLKFRSPNQSQP